MKPKVQVLLSTYNGKKYIVEQIYSILNQRDVDVTLLIRDDGSTDSTVNTIRNINDKRITILTEKNVGCTKSFMNLVELAGNADYYSFSDQDDVWDDDKLIKAINAIKQYDIPAIYSSSARLVDQNLNLISIPNQKPKTTLSSAIMRNYVAGCTTVFNKQLLDYLKLCDNPIIPFHDWWVNLVALSIGGVSLYDSKPHINYRQHSGNVVGAENSVIKKWKGRLNKFFNTQYNRDIMAEQLLKTYNDYISSDNKRILTLISKGKEHPFKVISSGYFHTGKIIDDIAFAICVLFKKI